MTKGAGRGRQGRNLSAVSLSYKFPSIRLDFNLAAAPSDSTYFDYTMMMTEMEWMELLPAPPCPPAYANFYRLFLARLYCTPSRAGFDRLFCQDSDWLAVQFFRLTVQGFADSWESRV